MVRLFRQSMVVLLLIVLSLSAAAEVAELPAQPSAMPEAVDTPIDLPIIEAETELPAPTEEIPEETAPFLPELTPPPAMVDTDAITGVASGSNYSWGYARLSSPTTGYSSASPDAQAVIYLERGVLFVSSRRTSAPYDRLRVHFSNKGETRSVWVDERHLRPMSAAEVLDFVSSRLNEGSVRLYGGDPMLPLDNVGYSSVITYSNQAPERAQETPAMFVNQMEIYLRTGETQPIGVSFSDGKGHAVHFMSEDETIAAVSADGRITGISSGSTHVQLKSEFSNAAIIEIHVQE